MYYLAGKNNEIVALHNKKTNQRQCLIFPDLEVYNVWVEEGKTQRPTTWQYFAQSHAEQLIGRVGWKAIKAMKEGRIEPLVVIVRPDGSTGILPADLQEFADA